MYSYDRRRNLGWLLLLSCAGASALPSCSSERPNFTVPDKDGTGGDMGGAPGDGDGDGDEAGSGGKDGSGGGKKGTGGQNGSATSGDGDGDTTTSTSCDGVEVDGACILACETEGEVRCEGECIDPKTNPDFCGATEACQDAGSVCDSDESCVLGACRSWGDEESVGPFQEAYGSGRVALVIDYDGNVTLSHNTSDDTLIAKRRPAGGSWSSARTLGEDVPSNPYSFPGLAVDGDGNVLAIWLSDSGHGWARYGAHAESWGPSAALILGTPDSGAGFASPSALVVAPSGDVFIGFDNVFYSAGTQAWTRRFGFEAEGWFDAVRHDENGAEEAGFGTLIVDRDSNVTGIWDEKISDIEWVSRASHFSAADNQWSSPEDLPEGAGGLGAADATGNLALVSCNGTGKIVPSSYDRAKGSWSIGSALVDNSNATIRDCMIASNSAGEMMLSWEQETSAGTQILVSSRNPSTRTWQGVTDIMGVSDSYVSPTNGMDAAGNAWVVANRYDDDGSEIIARRYDAEQDVWEDEIIIADAAAPEVLSRPQVAVSPSGSAIVVWSHQADSYSDSTVWARVYE